MKSDYLIHDLKSLCLSLQSQLISFPEPTTRKGKLALDSALQKSKDIRELVDAIHAAQRDERVSSSIFANKLDLVWLDDKVDDFKPIIEELREHDIDITPMTDVQEALEYIREHKIDGALVDLKIPGNENGLDFINATKGQIPCIAVSGYLCNSELQRMAIAHGAVGVLEKHLNLPGSNASFAGSVLGFFAEERRLKALEVELDRNPRILDSKVNEIVASLDELPDDTKEKIKPFLIEISSELSKSDPDVKKISAAGAAASNIAQGAAGNLAAYGILHLLGALF